MLTLAVIRTPERVVDHFSAVHRYGDAMRPAATWFGQGAAVKGQCYPIDPACLLPLLDRRIDEETLLGRGKGDNREHRQRQHDRHRATQAGLDLAALVARARQRGKASPRPVSATTDDASASATSIRAAEC